jgi:hypothetical protein
MNKAPVYQKRGLGSHHTDDFIQKWCPPEMIHQWVMILGHEKIIHINPDAATWGYRSWVDIFPWEFMPTPDEYITPADSLVIPDHPRKSCCFPH